MKKKLALILCAALMLQPAACFAESTTVLTEEAVAEEEAVQLEQIYPFS